MPAAGSGLAREVPKMRVTRLAGGLSVVSVLVVMFLALAPTAAFAGTSEELAQLPSVDPLNRTETTLFDP
jgi:hypothetical protein